MINKVNVGVFNTHSLWTSHLETELEIIQTEIDNANKIILFHCNGCISKCELIWSNKKYDSLDEGELRKIVCQICIDKQKRGYSLVDGKIVKSLIVSENELVKNYSIPDYYLQNISNLKELVVDEHYNAGWAILSSLISHFRDPFIDIQKHKIELNRLYQEGCRVYFSAKNNIKKHALNRVFVFNGRFSYTRAVLDAAQSMKIDCYVHERASHFTKYSIFKNHTIHNLKKINECIELEWENEKDEELKSKIGSEFFQNRANNIIGSWESFLDNQDPNLLPSNWDKNKHNIAVFTSSEDEFMSIGNDWVNPYFNSQLEGLKFLCSFIKNLPDYHLYIRVHPYSKLMAKNYLDELFSLSNFENVTLLEPESSVSSYLLLNKCNKVVTFGSTIGIEAVYWEKPSVLLGKAFYYYQLGPYIPTDMNKIEQMIIDKNLAAIKPNNAIKYGFYFNNFGVKYKFYEPTSYKSGKFKGVDLDFVPEKKPSLAAKIKDKVKFEYSKIVKK